MTTVPLVLIAEKTELLFEALCSCVKRILYEPKIVHVSRASEFMDELEHVDDFTLVVFDAELIREMAASLPPGLPVALGRVPSAMLVSTFDENERNVAIDAGIRSYLPKSAPSVFIIAGLASALCGIPFFPSLAEAAEAESKRKAVYQSAATVAQPAAVNPVTRRQMDVLLLLAEGCSNAEIAARLGISESTVRLHLRSAYQRLGVSNRVQAVREILRIAETDQ